MEKIWKYELKDLGKQMIEIPEHAKFLSLHIQNGNPCMWFIVNPNNNKINRKFEIYATGQDIYLADRKFIGTFLVNNGSLVFHVFEEI